MNDKTILLVEDDLDLQSIVTWNLEVAGYSVAAFADAPPALEWLRTHRPQAAVLDLMLPGMSGFELFEKIRALESCDKLPVIITTALQDEAVKRAGYKSGAAMVFRKPLSPTRLVKHVTAALSGLRQPNRLFDAE